MSDLLDQVLPVVTLLLGAGLTRRQGASTRVATARDRARDLLAEHTRYLWDKGDEGWVKLQVYLSSLRGPLRTAGVPLALVTRLREDIIGYWRNVADSGDAEVGLWLEDVETGKRLEMTVEEIYSILEAEPRWWSRLRRRRSPGKVQLKE